MDAQAILAEAAARVDRLLDELLPAADSSPAALHAAMRHLALPGGKRLRPALTLAGAEAVGGDPERALPLAAAVELIHTYSLVHDDLPCMDDDTQRRGRPTVHVLYGETVAVLAGDALQALAFESLARGADPELAGSAVGLLARAAGSRGLVGGQFDDLAWDGATNASPDDASAVESIHLRKSAALIAASIAGGALLAGGSAEDVEELERFGLAVGVAFQIADDLLDAAQDRGCSLVPVLGEAGASRRSEELLDEALTMIKDWGQRAERLRQLAHFAVRRVR